MKVEIYYHILPDPESIENGHYGTKSGGVKSVEITFDPYEETIKTKEFKAFEESLNLLMNKAKRLAKTKKRSGKWCG